MTFYTIGLEKYILSFRVEKDILFPRVEKWHFTS